MSVTETENMESSGSIHNTKVSDSGYSKSYSNSNTQSQRSGSSKSQNSGSSGCRGTVNTHPTPAAATIPSSDPLDKDRNTKDTNELNVLIDPIKESCTTKLTTADIASVSRIESESSGNVDEPKNEEPITREESQPQQDSFHLPDTIKSLCFLPGPSPKTCSATPLEDTLRDVDYEQLSGGIREQCSGATIPVTTDPDLEDGFRCIISMHDGIVLFATSSITHSLGFPKNMWIGQSFIDFVHSKDRATFASQVTAKVAVPLGAFEDDSRQNCQIDSLYVMLRKYEGLKSTGFVVTVSYAPYRLVLTFRELLEKFVPNIGRNILLVISATPVKSVYKIPNEQLQEQELKFSTTHKPCGKLNYVDGSSVELLGYLPQDILERSIMELYHPEDMPILKQIYEMVMVKGQTVGSTYASPSYRFLIQNGGHIVLQTEWTSFVNPWSRMIELIIGNHRVLEGPVNPDVFASSESDQNHRTFSNELLKAAKTIESEILILLKEPVAKPLNKLSQEVLQRCSIFEPSVPVMVQKLEQPGSNLNPLKVESNLTFSELNSITLGEISPHHKNLDSQSSSETPPSCNQLNYNDTLDRFFNSCPIVSMGESLKIDSSGGTNTERMDGHTNVSPTRQFNGSGDGSNDSSERNGKMPETTPTSSTGQDYSNSFRPPALTEEMLYLHDEDMQKVMLKKHRDERTLIRSSRKKKEAPNQKQPDVPSHGLKRGPSNAWEADNHKTFKHQHNPIPTANTLNNVLHLTAPINATTMQATPIAGPSVSRIPNTGIPVGVLPTPLTYGGHWQPVPSRLTALHTLQRNATASFLPSQSILPALHYIPTVAQPIAPNPIGVLPRMNNISIPYMTDMMYPQPVQLYQPSLIYSPMMYQAVPFRPIALPSELPHDPRNQQQPQNQPPPAQQTAHPSTDAIKTVPTVNSGKQNERTSLQKDSKHVFEGFPSTSRVGGYFHQEERKIRYSDAVDNPGSKAEPEAHCQANDAVDESTFSSLASSFLKTENSLGSNHVDKKDPIWTIESSMRRPVLPWLEDVNQTAERVYRYRIPQRSVNEVLTADLAALENFKQPSLVNDQLEQLYQDLDLDELSVKLSFSETSSGSSNNDYSARETKKIAMKSMLYHMSQMIYEENAPFPSPKINS
ncbi:period circadian protein-like [Topomyia yanbarensis]|uniref:period circadian protein-like n=1 Tax=Topomyia yanbarensis TaxID=2498891 RepID=UPI00273B6012|nr:period circadian protein-like [Topomyia yanbarensis]XP_058823805.1 period circadian protein-like [Topomyia yanbarensis]